MPKLLITGCGRSGTRYVTKVLANMGLEIGHEKEGRDGRADWRAAAWPKSELDQYVVLHQVRHPFGTVASWHTVMERSWDYVCEHESNVVREAPILLRCMQYWVYWNRRALDVATWTYRVEAMNEVLSCILTAVDAPTPADWRERLEKVPTTDHTRRKRFVCADVGIADLQGADTLLAERLLEMARTFGYQL